MTTTMTDNKQNSFVTASAVGKERNERKKTTWEKISIARICTTCVMKLSSESIFFVTAFAVRKEKNEGKEMTMFV